MSSIYVPDNPGTVSFTNGSTVINGTGTLFRGMSAGGLISIPGLGEMQLAEDPTSDTAAVGVVAWQGAATGPRPYQHIPRNSQATFSQKLVQLLEILAGGNVQSLAELTLAANSLLRGVGPGVIEAVDGKNVFSLAGLSGSGGNKVPIFTGVGTFGTLLVTTVMQSLLGSASAVAALDGLMTRGTSIASAGTLDLSTATGYFVNVTGTVATTAVTVPDGSMRIVRAAAAWPITSGASLVLNNGALTTYTCAANDMIIFVRDGSVTRAMIIPVSGRPTMGIAQNRLLGRVSASAGPLEDLTQDQVRTFLGMSSFFSGLLASASGDALFSSMGKAQSIGTFGGYLTLPGGVIIQYGQLAPGGSLATGTINFPTAFPNACRSVVGNIIANSANVFGLQFQNATATSFVFRKTFTTGAGVGAAVGEGFWWLAFGN